MTELALLGLLGFCFSKYGKGDHVPRKGALILFSFWLNTSGVLGQSQSEWLAEKELLGEESRTVSHESNSSASFNLHFLLKSSFLKEEENLCCC